jgi:hypothetical protein
MLRLRHVISMAVFGTALGGCYPPPLSTPAVVTPTVTSIYDGTYRGSVQVTYVAPMAQQSYCRTDAQASVQISNGSLTYVQPHPGYPDAPIVTYTATVTNDSKLNGTSDKNGTITGQIVSTHLTATLDGLGCSYSLDAQRS